MSKEYKVDKEYSLVEIIRYNLRMWWLAVIFAVLCAGALGAYKYTTLHQYVENEMYEDKVQVRTSLYVSNYSDGSVVERANNIIRIAKSKRAYDNFCNITGYVLTFDEYQKLFDGEQTEASDVITFYVTYPAAYGDFAIMEEQDAIAFAEGLIETVDETSQEMTGENCISVLDEPYMTHEVRKMETYSISQDDFRKAILKAVTAGALLGIIVEIVLYTFWMLMYRKPKNAEEIRECLDADIIDVLKNGEDNEDAFKKAAMFLKDESAPCNRIGCLAVKNQKTDTALKLAMSYANEQKKTLFVDLVAGTGNEDAKNSISGYILGEEEGVTPLSMNPYLDAVCRKSAEEKGMDIVGNRRFVSFIDEMSGKYECIVINSADVTKAAEGYQAAKLCDKVFVACGRKTVNNETLYKVKNTARVNGITIDGVLVYEL